MRYDWAKIEAEYVAGKESMEAIAARYGIAKSTFFKRAKERNFTQKRSKFREKAEEKSIARAQAREARRLERTTANVNGALDRAAKRINRLLDDDATLHGKILATEDGITEIRTNKADTKALRELTSALRDVASALQLMQNGGQGAGESNNQGVIILPERDGGEDA